MDARTRIGRVLSVNGNAVSIKLQDSVKSNMPIIDGIVYRLGQIGSFLKIPLGYANLYGIVTQTGASAIPDKYVEIYELDPGSMQNQQWLSMVLVGEQQGKRFTRGISQSPTTGDTVHLVTNDDLNVIYGDYNIQNTIDVGNISISSSLEARLDINKMISRHACILGSTGSGKSNAVGVILGAIGQKDFPNSRILLIDPHGEYNNVFRHSSVVFKTHANEDAGENELYIPFWALPFNELMSILGGSLSDVNKEYIRSKIVEEKKKCVEKLQLEIEREFVTADSPVPFSIKKLWYELDDFERQTFDKPRDVNTLMKRTEEGDPEKLISNKYPPASAGGGSPFLNFQAKGILGFLDNMRSKMKDSRYKFLFEPGDYSPDLEGRTQKGLNDLLKLWLGNTGKITILDFSDIPSEIMVSTSGTLLSIVYDALFWGQNLPIGGKQQPLLVVLEEAHNYLKSEELNIASRTVQKIAKEGRKYGVGLLLVSQRPSELDETVLSQCGTMIALRMNNARDRAHVQNAIQDELHNIVDSLSGLRTGEAIITGEGVKIPSRIQFYRLENAVKSSDPDVACCWKKQPNSDQVQYDKLVALWQNQSFFERKKGEGDEQQH